MPTKAKAKSAEEEGTNPIEHVDPLRLIALLPLRPHNVVAIIRAGAGHLAIPLAKYLYSGKVYAVTDGAETGRALKEKLAKIRLTNVVILQESGQSKVPKEGLDGILLPLTLNGAANKKTYLRKTADLLKPGAWAAVLEWYKRETPEGPPVRRRLDAASVMELAKETGYRFSERRDLDDQRYMVVLRK